MAGRATGPGAHLRPATRARLGGPALGALGAFAVAAIATILPWVSVAGQDFNTWDEGARFRFGDWLGMDNGDGYLIVVVALLGAVAIIGPLMARSFPAVRLGPSLAGVAILLIAGLQWQFINDQGPGLDPAYGVYVLGLAGIAAAVFGYVGEASPAR